jgi:hypothetical protein
LPEVELQHGPKDFHQLVREYKESIAYLPKEWFPSGLSQNVDPRLGNDITFYNPSSPFKLNDEEGSPTYQFFRVEPLSCEGSYAAPYKLENGAYQPVHQLERLKLEDPSVFRIQGKNILVGVEVWPDPTPENPKGTNYCNVFYEIIGNFDEYKPIGRGPNRMKGIKLIDLGDDGIGVMSRPHIDENNRGVLAFHRIQSLDELTPGELEMGNIISKQVPAGNWVGVNEMYHLPNGKLGILGHVAYEDGVFGKQYAAMVFQYDWKTHLSTPIKVIATVDEFPESKAKTPYHEGVMYPCALEFNFNDIFATLWASVYDAGYGWARKLNPW